jgi:lysylphosphatidylglycerol synthetase-like protein (DUF2156 family)
MSSKSKKTKKPQTQPKNKSQSLPPKKSKYHARRKPVERGTVLTVLLVIMALHGIFATVLYYSISVNETYINRPWLLILMVIHSLANVIAAAGIWRWKKWGWQLYIVSTVLSLVVGLLTVGAWSAFYMVLPLAIVGWALRTKWDKFA